MPPALRAAGPPADEVDGDDDQDDEAELVVTVFKGDDNVSTNGSTPQVGTSPVARIKALAEGVGDVDDWADQTDKAVARARSLGTPEAWEAAADAAVVVSEMARTMRSAAAAAQTATQLDDIAKAAADKARHGGGIGRRGQAVRPTDGRVGPQGRSGSQGRRASGHRGPGQGGANRGRGAEAGRRGQGLRRGRR